MYWNHLISNHWSALVAGKKIWIDVHAHHHPRNDSRFRSNTGWPDGQECDYTLSLSDESRIHVQCFGVHGGYHRLRIHRDQFDPDQGLGNFIMHGLLETPAGLLLATTMLLGTFTKGTA